MSESATRSALVDGLHYDRASRTYELDWKNSGVDELSTTIVLAVARAEGIDPTSVDPLEGQVDLDALNSLFLSVRNDADAGGATVSFGLSNHRVTVHADGRLELHPIDAPNAGSV